MSKMVISLLVFGLVFALLLLSGCEDNKADIILMPMVCAEAGTYCHLFRVDGGDVNLTFSSLENGTFNYSVES